MFFDIKMDSDFTRKSRLVAGGHKTAQSITHSSVVTRESVILALIIAGLNNIDICARDIVNAYLNSPCWESFWTKVG